MSFRVIIRQDLSSRPEGLEVETGGTILEAALAAGVPYPHGCQSGNCGACKSELLSGDVQMSPYSEHALSAVEKDQGLILACRSVPWSDCEIAWLEADDLAIHASRRMDCRVASIEDATHDIKIMRLAVETGGPFGFSTPAAAKLGSRATTVTNCAPPGSMSVVQS